MKSKVTRLLSGGLLLIGLFWFHTSTAQQEGIYVYNDGLIADYQPRLIELDASRNLLVKHSRYGWDSSLVNMVWLDHAGNVLSHKEHRLLVPLTFLFDVVKMDDGFVMCGVESGFSYYAFILKTDTAGNFVRLDHFTLVNNENIHSLLRRTTDAFTAYSSTPALYPMNYRIDGSMADTVYTVRRIQPAGGANFRMYDIIDAGNGKDLMAGSIVDANTGGGANNFFMKFDSASVDWVKSFDFSNHEHEAVYDVIKLTSGNYFFVVQSYPTGATVIDSYMGVMDDAGNLQWSKKVNIPFNGVMLSSAVETDSGDILVFGSTSYYAGFLLKVTPAGTVLWTKTLSNSFGTQVPGKITRNQFNKIAITGYINGSTLLIQTDDDGNACEWLYDSLATYTNESPVFAVTPAFSISPYTTTAASSVVFPRSLNHTVSPLCVGTGWETPEPEFNFSVYPNPAADQLHITLSATGALPVSVLISDVSGRRVYGVDGVYAGHVSLPVSRLDPGLYVVQVVNEKYLVTKRFIINR